MDENVSTIKSFVKDELGCLCPDSVFDSIDHQTQVTLEGIVLDSVFTIGDRLLIYIKILKESEGQGFVNDSLAKLVEHGKKIRDSKDLNRFRLVIITPAPNDITEPANQIFQKTIGNDDKLHLHILDEQALNPDVYKFW
jgi:hypothetical protein